MADRALVIAKGCSLTEAIEVMTHGVDLESIEEGDILEWTVRRLVSGEETHKITAFGRRNGVTVYVNKRGADDSDAVES